MHWQLRRTSASNERSIPTFVEGGSSVPVDVACAPTTALRWIEIPERAQEWLTFRRRPERLMSQPTASRHLWTLGRLLDLDLVG